MTQIHKLKNDMQVVAAPLKERKSISVGIWTRVGARNESAKTSGVSHFLEHLVFKGTKTRTANDIKESVEGVGGSLNAFTSEEYTCFYARCAERNFDRVFDVLADMVLNATLKKEDIEKERGVILEEIKMTQDHPSELADELLSEIVWANHALGRPIAGTLDTVSAISEDEIRGHRDYFYEPGSLLVAAAGAIDEKKLIKITESFFSSRKPLNNKHKFDLFKKDQKTPQLKTLDKKTEQTHLALGLHGVPKNDPMEYAVDILHVLLGGNMSSRLFNEVREERGLAYEISTFIRKYDETGLFGVNAGVDNAKAGECLEVVIHELNKIMEELVPDAELQRAKEFYLGQLDLGLESTMNQMLWIGESAMSLGRIRTYAEVEREIRKITPEKIRDCARLLFKTPHLNLAIVGPQASDISKSFSKLRF